jgi:hypothetical protein
MKFAESMSTLEGALDGTSEAADRAAKAFEDYAVLWQRWKVEFCLTATDEEIAEADRLFPPETASD